MDEASGESINKVEPKKVNRVKQAMICLLWAVSAFWLNECNSPQKIEADSSITETPVESVTPIPAILPTLTSKPPTEAPTPWPTPIMTPMENGGAIKQMRNSIIATDTARDFEDLTREMEDVPEVVKNTSVRLRFTNVITHSSKCSGVMLDKEPFSAKPGFFIYYLITAGHCLSYGEQQFKALAVDRPQLPGTQVINANYPDMASYSPVDFDDPAYSNLEKDISVPDVGIFAFIAEDYDIPVLGKENVVSEARMQPGEKVNFVNYPKVAYKNTVYFGTGIFKESYNKRLLFTALGSGGSSGGGYFNEEGKLVGIVSSGNDRYTVTWASIIPENIDQLMRNAKEKLPKD